MGSGGANGEVLGIVRRICPVVLSSAVDPRGINGTSLRRCVGMMSVGWHDGHAGHSSTRCALQQAVAALRRGAGDVDRIRKAALTGKTVSSWSANYRTVRLQSCA